MGIETFYSGDFLNSGDLYPRGWEIFENLRIFIPGIGDFSKSGDFDPGDWGFFKIWGFSSPGIGDFFGIFHPRDFWGSGFFGDGDFFSWDGIYRISYTVYHIRYIIYH